MELNTAHDAQHCLALRRYDGALAPPGEESHALLLHAGFWHGRGASKALTGKKNFSEFFFCGSEPLCAKCGLELLAAGTTCKLLQTVLGPVSHP